MLVTKWLILVLLLNAAGLLDAAPVKKESGKGKRE